MNLTNTIRVLFCGFLISLCCQSQIAPTSDVMAVSLAQRSMAAMTGGTMPSDASLSGKAIWIAGSDKEVGSVTLSAKGTGESRIDLHLSVNTRTEIRTNTAGYAQGATILNGGTQQPWPPHNCMVDASWFLPALSALARTSDPAQVFLYIGRESRNGISVDHLRTLQYRPNVQPRVAKLIQTGSTTDIYLDAASSLPVAFNFNTHPEDDLNTNIAVEIDFSNYQAIGGVLVPMHIQKLIWNGLALDITVTNASFNTGLSDSVFAVSTDDVN